VAELCMINDGMIKDGVSYYET